MKKRILPVLLILVLLFTSNIMVYATDNNFNEAKVKEVKSLILSSINNGLRLSSDDAEELINSMSNDEFDTLMSELFYEVEDKEKIKDVMGVYGVEIDILGRSNSEQVRLTSSYMNISVSYAKRSSESFYRLYSYANMTQTELMPGTDDLVAIYFDKTIARYYDYNTVGSHVSLRSTSQSSNGTIAFNFDDSVAGTNQGTCVVYVIPLDSASNQFYYGSEWKHTYTTKTVTGVGATVGIVYTGDGLVPNSIGVDVSLADNNYEAVRSAENHFYC